MSARTRQQSGRDDYPSLMDIIDAAGGIQGLIDWGGEHPLVMESLVIAVRVLRRAARLDPPGAKVAARGPTAPETSWDMRDLAIAMRLLYQLLDNPELADAKIQEPMAIAAALIERAMAVPRRRAT
jgi:hypothetical protein